MEPSFADMAAAASGFVAEWQGAAVFQGEVVVLHLESGRQFVVRLAVPLGTAARAAGLPEGGYALARYNPDVLWQAQHLR